MYYIYSRGTEALSWGRVVVVISYAYFNTIMYICIRFSVSSCGFALQYNSAVVLQAH